MIQKMNNELKLYCRLIRNRSIENQKAMSLFPDLYQVLSPAFSILRQELDSLVRVIYLLSIESPEERQRLIISTLSGHKWQRQTLKGKWKNITDKEMVDLAQKLNGWTLSVYKFGCAFIHLSDFHNHHVDDPFMKLKESEKNDILTHMRYYHGGPISDHPDMKELSRYLVSVLNKISGNLECYLEDLKNNKHLDY